jgi:hypothetical protein
MAAAKYCDNEGIGITHTENLNPYFLILPAYIYKHEPRFFYL